MISSTALQVRWTLLLSFAHNHFSYILPFWDFSHSVADGWQNHFYEKTDYQWDARKIARWKDVMDGSWLKILNWIVPLLSLRWFFLCDLLFTIPFTVLEKKGFLLPCSSPNCWSQRRRQGEVDQRKMIRSKMVASRGPLIRVHRSVKVVPFEQARLYRPCTIR